MLCFQVAGEIARKHGNMATGLSAWYSQLRAGLFFVTVITLSLKGEEPLSTVFVSISLAKIWFILEVLVNVSNRVFGLEDLVSARPGLISGLIMRDSAQKPPVIVEGQPKEARRISFLAEPLANEDVVSENGRLWSKFWSLIIP